MVDLDSGEILAHIRGSLHIYELMLRGSALILNLMGVETPYVKTDKSNEKILMAGNGSTISEAQRLTGELVGRFHLHRPALSVIALKTDSSILTAGGNDHGYQAAFLRKVKAHGLAGDVLITISTSGNSARFSIRSWRPK